MGLFAKRAAVWIRGTYLLLSSSRSMLEWSVHDPLLTIIFFEQAIPDRQGFRLFSIDPSDHDSVEVANQLWKLIEGVPHRQ